jgi:PAS domain-containing protein
MAEVLYREARIKLNQDWSITQLDTDADQLDAYQGKPLSALLPELFEGEADQRRQIARQQQTSISFRFQASQLGQMAHAIWLPKAPETEMVLRWSPAKATISWSQRLLFDGEVMERILNHTLDLAMVISPIFEVMYFNQAAYQRIKQSFDHELQLRDDFWRFVISGDEEGFLDRINRAFTGKTVHHESQIEALNGPPRWFHHTYFPVHDDKGELFGIALLYQDVDDLKQAQAEVQHQQRKLSHISFHQSHRIRRHVANLIGLISLIEEKTMSDEARRLLKLAGDETGRLDEVIHEITNDIYS